MGTGNTYIKRTFTDQLQNITSFHHFVPVLPVINQFRMPRRNRWCIYHEFSSFRDQCGIVFIMHVDPAGFKFPGQGCWGLIIPAHFYSTGMEETGDGTHADSSDSDKVDLFQVVNPPKGGIHKDSIGLYGFPTCTWKSAWRECFY